MVFLQEIIFALPVSLTIMAAASIVQLLQRLGLSVNLHCVLLQVTLQQVKKKTSLEKIVLHPPAFVAQHVDISTNRQIKSYK